MIELNEFNWGVSRNSRKNSTLWGITYILVYGIFTFIRRLMNNQTFYEIKSVKWRAIFWILEFKITQLMDDAFMALIPPPISGLFSEINSPKVSKNFWNFPI